MTLLETTTSDTSDTDLLVCDGLSVEHVDGSADCEYDCDLPHALHVHVAACTELELVCSCSPDEHSAGGWLTAA